MIKNSVLFLGLLMSSFVFAQTTVETGSFNALKVSDKIPLKLVKSDKNVLEIEKMEEEDLSVSNTDGKLKIGMRLSKKLKGEESLATLYYSGDIKDIRATEGAKIVHDGDLDVKEIKLRANKGSEIDFDLTAEKVVSVTNSGGRIYLQGKADEQAVTCNTGGQFFGKSFKTKITKVTVKAGGEAEVYAEKKAEAKTRAGGRIDVFGPAEVSEERFAGGRVKVHRE